MNSQEPQESSQINEAKPETVTGSGRAQENKATSSPNFLIRVENILKIVTGGAVVTAIIGLPAVYFQYAKFGIPTSFITYDQVLQAGVAPALILFFVAAYIYLAIGEFKIGASKMGAFMLPRFLFSPIPVLVFLVAIVGLVAGATWIWWHFLWPFFWVLTKLGVSVSERFHLYFATGFGVSNTIFPIIWGYVSRFIIPWWEKVCARISFLNKFFGRYLAHRKQTRDARKEKLAQRVQSNEGASRPKGQQKKEEGSKFRNLLYLTGGVALYLLFGLYSIRWYIISQLGLDFPILVEHDDVFFYVLTGTLGTLSFMTLGLTWSYMHSEENMTKRLLVTSLNIFIVLALSTVAIWYYSLHLYPNIPAAFGGGRSEPIVLWFPEKDFSKDVVDRLQNSNCVTIGSVVRCGELYLFHMGTKYVILTDTRNDATNAILIPKDKIQAFSW